MPLVQLALYAVVATLALALIGYLLRPHLRSRHAAPAAVPPAEPPQVRVEVAPHPQALVCPACHRDYAPDLRYCPHDARELVTANDPAIRAAGAGSTCPTCKRSYDAGKKFCAFDGEELVPLPVALGGGDPAAVALAGALGKICPNCSRRYESDATFCGRDGEELVPVN